jgi:hypothetical protein
MSENRKMEIWKRRLAAAGPHCVLLCSLAFLAHPVIAVQPVIPGTGIQVEQVGDDFEDPEWRWNHNWPKSSQNLDDNSNTPAGDSENGRWYEGIKRGHPDYIKRVSTPPGGLDGSTGSLLLRSLYTGIPYSPSREQQQDDLICDVMSNLDGAIPVGQAPNMVVRVFLPPVDKWENRSGCHFAFRCALDTTVREVSRGWFATESYRREVFYPGIFIDFEAREDTGRDYDSAAIRIRGDGSGNDYKAREIAVTGWWTLGLSVTGDGMLHYYARPGVENLTAKDRLASHLAEGYRAERLRTFFFNVCNGDDGKTWSTEWIIDDPTVYVVKTQ